MGRRDRHRSLHRRRPRRRPRHLHRRRARARHLVPAPRAHRRRPATAGTERARRRRRRGRARRRTSAGAVGPDAVRGVDGARRSRTTIADLQAPPVDTHDVYLRLHLLSHRLVRAQHDQPRGDLRAPAHRGLDAARPGRRRGARRRPGCGPGRRARRCSCTRSTSSPACSTTSSRPGVRIADASRVRLGAHLAEGTSVMHEGFVNFNAGTLGTAMVEGRLSQGVVMGEGSDLGGGASVQGTLSGGGTDVVRIGERCLVGANGGIGISLGDDCVVEAGLYVTAGTRVTLPDGTRGEGAARSAASPTCCSSATAPPGWWRCATAPAAPSRSTPPCTARASRSRRARRSADQREAVVGLHHGDPHVAGAVGAVELARATRARRRARRAGGPGPTRRRRAPAPTGRTRRPGSGASTPTVAERRRHRLEPARGSGRAARRRGRRRPTPPPRRPAPGPGTMKPGVLAHLGQVAHELGVAGVEAGPGAGQVRALRQRVHGEHARRCRARGSCGAGPSHVNST